jgi:hypothetical protein
MEDTELVPYLNAFFPGWDVPGVDKSKFVTMIILETDDSWLQNGVQLLPFVRLLAEAPNVDIEICDESWEAGEQITQMWKCREAWAKALQGAVEDVSLVTKEEDDTDPTCHTRGNEIHILLGKQFTAPWLGDAKITDVAGAVAFVNDLGLEGDECSLRVWLGLQSDAEYGKTVWRKVNDE